MPPYLYNSKTKGFYANEEEKLAARRFKDNIKQKLRYWRSKYGYDIDENDYQNFNNHSSNIKHIYDIHNWFINYESKQSIPDDMHKIFFQRQAYILRALVYSQDYIKTLKKIKSPEENISNQEQEHIEPKTYVLDF